jgi:hypothetical protein
MDAGGPIEAFELETGQAQAIADGAAALGHPPTVTGRAGDAGLEGRDEPSQPRVPGRAWLGDARGSRPRLDRFWGVERLQHFPLCLPPTVQSGGTHSTTIAAST